VVSEELGEFGTVGRVLMDAELLERGGEKRVLVSRKRIS
jgi:hypothetical protein